MITLLRIFGALCLALLLAGCGATSQAPAATPAAHEVGGDRAARVAEVTRIIAATRPPPSALLDARFLEERIGDGSFGPSDYRAFYALDVAPADMAQWTAQLVPLSKAPGYTSPAASRSWWVTREDFGSLQFYEPAAFTGRAQGWVGVAPATGRIFIYTFTT